MGGVDKVGAFMSLLYGNKLKVAVVTDVAKGQKKKIEDLKKFKLLDEAKIIGINAYTSTTEADVEDMIGREGYLSLVSQAYSLSSLAVAQPGTERVVKDVEDGFRTLPVGTPEFDHFQPALFLIENPAKLKDLPGYEDALKRFEALFVHLNGFSR